MTAFPSSRTYRTGTPFTPLDFYKYSFESYTRIDLLLGYFSSNAIRLISLQFAKFIFSGGQIRIIANQQLRAEDSLLLRGAYTVDTEIDLANLEEIKKHLDQYTIHFFNCLSYLIQHKRLQIKIVRPKSGVGISHYKSGYMENSQDQLSFKGSCNFTFNGLISNHEEIDINLSIDGQISINKIEEQKNYFNKIWQNEDPSLVELSDDELVLIEKSLTQNKVDINTILKQEEKLIASYVSQQVKERSMTSKEPKFPFREGPRTYQIEAYNNWRKKDMSGIFSMATGTGKTITSLNCLLELYKIESSYKALIIAPTLELVDQWRSECLKFEFSSIFTISSKTNWQSEIQNLLYLSQNNQKHSFIIIVTYASFAKLKLLNELIKLPKSTLIIADEAHNLGARQFRNHFKDWEIKRRIGLTATPERKFDEIGTMQIENIFNDTAPYCYNFTMSEAITQRFLTPYSYYPIAVYLTEEENKKYNDYTRELLKYYNPNTNTYIDEDKYKSTLLKRKRIINKAENKITAFKEVLNTIQSNRKNLKYTLVFAPEGVENNFENETYDENKEDEKMIDMYTKAVSDIHEDIFVSQFTSMSSNRQTLIKQFNSGETDVLVSMKCLDEGVDLPRAEIAIFCSSSSNPRQFIQRRGRILRNHKDKSSATIYDLIIFPSFNNDLIAKAKNLIKTEFDRVVEFSSLSMNKQQTRDYLNEKLQQYNLTYTELSHDE